MVVMHDDSAGPHGPCKHVELRQARRTNRTVVATVPAMTVVGMSLVTRAGIKAISEIEAERFVTQAVTTVSRQELPHPVTSLRDDHDVGLPR